MDTVPPVAGDDVADTGVDVPPHCSSIACPDKGRDHLTKENAIESIAEHVRAVNVSPDEVPFHVVGRGGVVDDTDTAFRVARVRLPADAVVPPMVLSGESTISMPSTPFPLPPIPLRPCR